MNLLSQYAYRFHQNRLTTNEGHADSKFRYTTLGIPGSCTSLSVPALGGVL